MLSSANISQRAGRAVTIPNANMIHSKLVTVVISYIKSGVYAGCN